nr:hypothetical protein [Actinoplanes hotanensis]
MLIRPITTTSGSRMEASSAYSGGRVGGEDHSGHQAAEAQGRDDELGDAGSGSLDRGLPQGRAGGDPGGAARGSPDSEERDYRTGGCGGRPGDPRARGLQVERGDPDGPHQPENGRGERCAEQTTDRGGRGRDDDGLAQQEPAHLPWRRADQAQQAELTLAAGHDEAERTANHEQSDERRDRRHHPEHRGQVVELGALVGGDAGPAGTVIRGQPLGSWSMCLGEGLAQFGGDRAGRGRGSRR